jgi:methylmalonyl-CoA epimerase
VLRTVATSGTGLPELVQMIERFRTETGEALGARRRARAEWRLREILGRGFMQHVEAHVLAPGEFEQWLDRIAAREVDPYGAADAVMARALQGAGPMPIDHVGIATPKAEEYAAMFKRLFGLRTGEQEQIGKHLLRFVETGDATLELVEPTADDAPIAKYMEKRGPGLHHVCFRVKDIDRAMADLKARGVKLIDETPRKGAHGSRIAFIHPSETGGVLIELKQPK